MRSKQYRYSWLSVIFLSLLLAGCTQQLALPTMTPSPTYPAKDLASIIEYYATETAVARSNMAAAVTPSPALTLSPTSSLGTPSPATPATAQAAATATLTSAQEWREMPVIGPAIVGFESLGDNPFLVAILSALLTLILAFFRRIATWVGKAGTWAWSRIRLRSQDYEFEKEYLDWIIGQHRHLGILPAQVVIRGWGERQHLVDLEDIFIQLSVSTQFNDEEVKENDKNSSWLRASIWVRLTRFFLSRLVTSSRIWEILLSEEVIDPWYISGPQFEAGDPSVIIARNTRLVFRGDPGSGKTTLMRYLAVTCARALRQNQQDGDRKQMVRDRLHWTKMPFPILIKLSKHSNVINWGSERGLLEAFQDELPLELRKICPPKFFEDRLRSGPCLILLDAFDELGSPLARATMAQRIGGFLEVYGQPRHRIVVTTRIVGYEGQLDRYGFRIRTVQALTSGEIRALVKLRYKAIGATESVGRGPMEVTSIQRKILERAQTLIARIETTDQLRQLATNPMLLSLIVLVHFLKVELPEERVLLYRDCVEILTERWQQYKREEAGITKQQSLADTLTMTQKLMLLREIAYEMQEKKDKKNSQALIRKDIALKIVAQKLPDLIVIDDSRSGISQRTEYLRYAENWIAGIQENSGILVEQGLDHDGEPLIGFSHLTFQEYLTAIALYEVPAYQSALWKNLSNPSWREVILLFAVITNDATPIIQRLIEDENQLDSILLAGSCLAEQVRRVDPQVQATALHCLTRKFEAENGENAEEVGLVLGGLLNDRISTFLIEQLTVENPEAKSAAARALGNMKSNNPSLNRTRLALLHLLETDAPVEVKVIARESLARIGDPRFIDLNPIMIVIPSLPYSAVNPYKEIYKDVRPEIDLTSFKTIFYSILRMPLVEIVINLLRNVDCFLYQHARKILRSPNYVDSFSISKYPVTNSEYKRFIDDTGHPAPEGWIEGIFPLEKSTYPVANLGSEDFLGYCEWLSRKTNFVYRIPTEWEWEVAAGGPEICPYPWGEEFNPDLANTSEQGKELLPVGMFPGAQSVYGVHDVCGNAAQDTFSPVTTYIVFSGLLQLALIWSGMALVVEFLSFTAGFKYSVVDLPLIIGHLMTLDFNAPFLFTRTDMFFVLLVITLLQLGVILFTVLKVFHFLRAVVGLSRVLGTDPSVNAYKRYGLMYFFARGGSWKENQKQSKTYFRTRPITDGAAGLRIVRNEKPRLQS